MRKRKARTLTSVALRWLRRALLALVLLCGGYGIAGLVGGAIATNRHWREAQAGITIWVESNGVHTGLILPKRAAGVDWRRLLRPEHLADPRYAGWDYAAFGWGEEGFYIGTPTWWDVRPNTIMAAAVGSNRTLMHVDHLPRPVAADDVRAITLTPSEYRRLAAFIRASFAADRPRHRGYAGYDVFYPSHGHYDAIRTCNAWTGDALRHAGIRIGWWTPFPVTVMHWFRRPAVVRDG